MDENFEKRKVDIFKSNFTFYIAGNSYHQILGSTIIIMYMINKEWHLKNLMPKNPTLDQRITWHLGHVKNCKCRPLEGKILEEIKKRGIKI